MRLRTFSTGLALLLTSFVTPIVRCQEQGSAPARPLLTFTDLQHKDLTEDAFRIAGYVMQVYKCPPCPPGMMCKPCLGDHILITNNVHEKDPLFVKRLRVFTKEPERFEVGKKYLLTVKIRGKRQPDKELDAVDLIGFEGLDPGELKPGR